MSNETKGWWLGFCGVAIFALTLPFTHIAVREFDPLFVSVGRAVVAACLALPLLLLTRQTWPSLADLRALAFVIGGVIFGFPIFSALAMTTVPASHGGVVLGALPLATALMATIFAGERPSPRFWVWSLCGSAAVIIYALWDGGGGFAVGDIWLALSVLAAAMGYAAGGQLSKKLGGWQVISWALVVALPITVPLAWLHVGAITFHESRAAWASFIYVALFSQLIGFFFWNKGLSLGGIARVGQVQLLQTFMTLAASALFLGEVLSWRSIGFATIVAACVYLGRKAASL